MEIMSKRRRKKVLGRTVLVNTLAIVSILGFLGVISIGIFDINIDIGVSNAILIVFGVGLAVIGNIFGISEYMKKGLNRREIGLIVTAIIGLLAIITGILGFVEQTVIPVSRLATIRGIIALIAVVIIVLQTWIVRRK
jgi:hypothetical protein